MLPKTGQTRKLHKIPDAFQSSDYGECRCRTSILRRMILRAGETLDLKEPRNAGIWLDFTTRIMTSWDWRRYAFVHFLRSNSCWGHPWQDCNCVHVRLWVIAFVSRRWKSSRWTDGWVWAEQSETDWSTGLDVLDLGCRIEACHFVISEYFYSPQGWSSFIVCLFSPSRILSQMQWRLLAWIRPCWAFDFLVSTILCPKLLIISAIPLAASEVRQTGCFSHEFHIVSIGISHAYLSVEVIGIQSWARQTAVELAQARVVCKRAVLAASPDANTTSLDMHSVALYVWEPCRFRADPVNHRLLQKSLMSSCVRSESSGCLQCLSSVVPKFSTNSLSAKWLPLGSLQVVLAWKERCETSFPEKSPTATWIVFRNTDDDILKAAVKFKFWRQSLQWLGVCPQLWEQEFECFFLALLRHVFFVRSLDAFLAFAHGVSVESLGDLQTRWGPSWAMWCLGWDCQDLHTYLA